MGISAGILHSKPGRFTHWKRKMPCTSHTQHILCDTTDYICLAPKRFTTYNSQTVLHNAIVYVERLRMQGGKGCNPSHLPPEIWRSTFVSFVKYILQILIMQAFSLVMRGSLHLFVQHFTLLTKSVYLSSLNMY